MDPRQRLLVGFVVLSLGLSACSGVAATPTSPPALTAAPTTTNASVAPPPTSAQLPTAVPTQTVSETATPVPAAPTATPVAVVPTGTPGPKVPVVVWMDASSFIDSYTTNVVNVFNAQSAKAEVQVVSQANAETAERTALAAGQGPDIVFTDGPSIAAELAQANQLLSLDSYADSLGWNQHLLPWATAVSQVDGHLYSIPGELETLVIYYNKDLFAKKGWTVPTTLDELTALATQVKAAGLIPFANANADYKGADAWHVSEFLNHVAGPAAVKAALTGSGQWTADGMVQAITLLNTYQQNGWFMGGLDKYYTTTFAAADTALATGKAAMEMNGTWDIGDGLVDAFKKAGQNVGWFAMPTSDGSTVLDLSIGDSLSINANSPNPDAAAEFVTWLLSPAGQYQLALTGTNPHPLPADPHVMSALDPTLGEILSKLADVSATEGTFGYTDWTFAPPKTDDSLNTDIELVWAGQETPTEYLTNAQTIFDQEKTSGTLLPVP